MKYCLLLNINTVKAYTIIYLPTRYNLHFRFNMCFVGGRRDRSRSPLAVDSIGRRRGHTNSKKSLNNVNSSMDKRNDNTTNPMASMNALMMNNMYQQGNIKFTFYHIKCRFACSSVYSLK